MVCCFMPTSFSLKKWVYAESCHCLSVYFAEAGVGTRSHALLGMRSFIRRRPKEYLDQTRAWRGVFMRVRA